MHAYLKEEDIDKITSIVYQSISKMTIKLLSIIGTRPQFIKSAIVSSEIDAFNKGKQKNPRNYLKY